MKIGFLGFGNMARAMTTGILFRQEIIPSDITVFDIDTEKTEAAAEKFGINTASDNIEVVKNSDIILLTVKPQFYEEVIEEIRTSVEDHNIIVTVAPGKTIEWLEEKFLKKVKLIRTMPNTPALVLEGMTAMCANSMIEKEDFDAVKNILESFGEVEPVAEKLLDVVVSVSGSSPAYVYMIIEAMADAAVHGGMSRELAYRFAAQAVMGSAKMVKETDFHPATLKDMVCSPGGTTIEAVRTLEQKGLRSAIFEAMKACEEKSKNM